MGLEAPRSRVLARTEQLVRPVDVGAELQRVVVAVGVQRISTVESVPSSLLLFTRPIQEATVAVVMNRSASPSSALPSLTATGGRSPRRSARLDAGKRFTADGGHDHDEPPPDLYSIFTAGSPSGPPC